MTAKRSPLAIALATAAIASAATYILGTSVIADAAGKHEFAAGEPGDPKKPFRVVEITMTESDGEMAYEPSEIPVRKGEQIKFVIKNAGALDHEFMLDSFEHNAKHKIAMMKNPEMIHDDPNGKRLASKGSSELIWKFTDAGSFEFACLIPGHYESGMHGVVIVTAGK